MNRLLDLHISQAGNALNKAKNNSYSDKNKEDYQNNLTVLFQSVKNDIKATPPTQNLQIFEHKKKLDFIFKSLEFLDSSTFNLIPYEIIECLNCAMNDWLETDDKYTIVTSLINNVSAFSFDGSIAFNDPFYALIKQKYNIEFTHRLVQINLPRALSRDYLSSVVLYHELGHFIDFKYSITSSLAIDVINKFINNQLQQQQLDAIIKYIPFIQLLFRPNQDPRLRQDIIRRHLAEYFCDLFASQYIGNTSNYYLAYITEEQSVYSNTHPSTTNRVELVNSFLNSSPNLFIDLINDAIFNIKKSKFEIRYKEIKSEDFYRLIPVEINNEKELHGLYKYGWEIWLSDWKKFESELKLSEPFDRKKIYSIINNLMEKAIGNYITINKWKQAHPNP